ncbi:ABC-F family ATP-binding cassette domain-containing protein [Oceanibaculum pacificum]|uniref:Probable ATP-binding protein YheS n=1 Tax=Oceanibaculum pacificum TaxID=580166 RepID=A0A154VXB9_9PROT|nr:ABC-F family ATP-binding cassette domain-containing protein [Oceanibaculum pacificum]KZD05868.1 glycosyl transferase family 1 [Oceanibaculum pacificum]
MLQIQNLTYRIAGRVLFDEASVSVPTGHKVGMVGRNGTGKSTLLKLITADLQVDGGSIGFAGKPRIGKVAQEAPGGDTTPLQAVMAADTERTALLAEAETATDPIRISEIQMRLADIGAHSAEARAGSILAGLGFDTEMQNRPLDDFSGGWRMRVALAATLFSQPDLLLLDEPTNHLDLEATLWLEGYLKHYPHTILLVSHDRDLLNRAVDGILHLENGKLTYYRGTYDNFVRQRAEKLAQLEAQRKKVDAQRKHMQAFVDRFRYKASKARQAQSRIKAIEKLGTVAAFNADPSVVFRFPQPEEMAPPLISLDRAAVGYAAGKPILRQIGLRIDPDDRIALLGANGNGKSTLAKLIAGRLTPMEGDQHRSAKFRVGFFAQHQIEDLEAERTPYDHMHDLMPNARPELVRSRLGAFGFSQNKADVKISGLSGGERARLTLALITHDAPHMLILDEPTNHLDVDARDALIQALNEYQGAVVLISHDPHLVELTADRLLLVADGRVTPFDGDMEDYRRLILGRNKAAKDERVSYSDMSADERQEVRRIAAEQRKQLAPLRKKADAAEKLLERLTGEHAKIAAALGRPAIYNGPKDKLAELMRVQGELEKKIAETEAAWMEAEAALEKAG